MAGDHHRSVNSIYQRPRRSQEGAEGAAEGSNRRRRTASRRRGPSPPTPREEDRQPQEEVAPVDELDEELVRQTEEEEEEEEGGGGRLRFRFLQLLFECLLARSREPPTGSASSPTASDSPRRTKVSNFIGYHHYFI